MADFRKYSHDFVLEFITAYQDNPCLWKISSADYGNRSLKKHAYEQLLVLVRNVDENADFYSVKKKINTLRACFRKENKKVQLAASEGGVYRPKLWYYSLLYFLDDQDELSQSVSQNDEDNRGDVGDYQFGPDDDKNNLDQIIMESPCESMKKDSNNLTNSIFSPTKTPESRKKHKRSSEKDDMHDLTRRRISLGYSGIEDEYDAVGRNVAAKLRRLPETTKIIAEKLINDVLFKAQINTLTVDSNVSPSAKSI